MHIAALAAMLLLLPVAGFAAVYHIDPTAGSGGDGSAADPFDSWSDLPSMSASYDVYIKCGTTLTPSSYLNITWGGTSGDPAVIGAYYMDGANAVYGVSGNRPIISGNSHTVPTNLATGSATQYRGLIDVQEKDYIHIENLHIYQSGYDGIRFNGDYNASDCVGFSVTGCKIESSYSSSIRAVKAPYNVGSITNNEVTYSGMGWGSYHQESTFPAAIAINNCPHAGATVSENYVHDTYSEGIGAYRTSGSSDADETGYCTIENNLVYNSTSAGIYLCSQNNTVRFNIVIGQPTTANFTYFNKNARDGLFWNGTGISVWMESSFPTLNDICDDNLIYSNIVTGREYGIRWGSQFTTGSISNNKIYNNTLIGNRYNISTSNYVSSVTLSGNEIKNNVSICPSGCASADTNANYTWIATKTGLAIDHNSWDSTTTTSNWAGTGDVVSDTHWSKLSGWQSITDPSTLSITDFMPLSNSTAIDNADDLGSPYNLGISIYDTSYNIPIFVTTVER